MESQFAQAIRMLVPEQRFGAAKIAEIAANTLLHRVSSDTGAPDAFRQELLQTGWEIIRARPTMAPLVNLVSNVLWKIEGVESPHELHNAVTIATSEFKRQLRQHAVHVAEEALNLIEDGSTIVTLSLSTTVQYALSHAQRAGRHFSVICAESRPICEGRHTAEVLASLGIPVTLMADTAALSAVPSAQLVLVGADMLTHRGLVNKTGTFGLAAIARASGVPFYTLCGSTKFLPAKFQPPVVPDWPASEVWDQRRLHLTIHNPPCDTTALELVSGIVTERGTLPTAAIEAWLAALRIHPALTMSHADLVEQI
ncbi:MAG: translation initiation factor eIF-2B [Roseiflexaceae bacterium]|nr:translation initiation factor eIF-2B [Roseiflexaceae bacterium]